MFICTLDIQKYFMFNANFLFSLYCYNLRIQLYFLVGEMEPRTLHMLGKCSLPLQSSASELLFTSNNKHQEYTY